MQRHPWREKVDELLISYEEVYLILKCQYMAKNGCDILTVLKTEFRSNSNFCCMLVILEQNGLLPTFGYSKLLLSILYDCNSNDDSKNDKA